MKVNWNLLNEVYKMQKNYHLPAYEVDKEDLLRAIQLIEEANKNEKTVEIITRALC